MSAAIPGPLKTGLSKSNLRADKIRIGAIGINGMGWSDLNAMLKAYLDTICTAICDVDSNVLSKRSADLEKNFSMKAAAYGDYRKLLDDKNIDAVIIATPDHWHCLRWFLPVRPGKMFTLKSL